MLSILAFVLNAVTDAFISKLVESTTDEVKEKLRKDPAKVAFKKALGAAIQRYANAKNIRGTYLTPSLVEKKSFLTLPAVIEELTHLVHFDREPDAQLIGQKWKEAFDDPPTWCDFTAEAYDFIAILEKELRDTDVFRPVFDTHSLADIATNTAISAQSLLHIETQLTQLQTLLETQFVDLISAFSGASLNIRDHIRDYTRFIHEKVHDFVGRQFVVEAFTHFTERYQNGYFFLRGDPGIGKSAFAAHMVQVNGYVHHFNIRSEGINSAEKFLDNLCAQLIARYQLDYAFLPLEATRDAGFLHTLLEKISARLQADEKVVIVVDALDEVDSTGTSSGANTLYLPMNLPPQIYFLVTMRRVPLNMRIECDHQVLDLLHDSAENLVDIQAYLAQMVNHAGIQRYINAQGIDTELFIGYLVEKSEGNFIYLRYVLPEIEQGAYRDLDLKALPHGLDNYYEDHWRRIREKNQQRWLEDELPVIATLTAVYKPISIQFIARRTSVSTARISSILIEWEQFLHSEIVTEGDVLQERYSVYHMSFHDFLAQKKEVEGGRSVLQEAHSNIARSLLRKGSKDGKLSRNTQ
jgi:hypothetical protein